MVQGDLFVTLWPSRTVRSLVLLNGCTTLRGQPDVWQVATLFNGLTSHEMHILAEHAEVCYPEPGEVLAQLGTVIDWLGIVCAGHLQCLSEEGEKVRALPWTTSTFHGVGDICICIGI